MAAALAAAPPASAQSKVGTTIGQFLGIEPSARHAGMGNAGVALFEGIESVYFNPGAMGALDRPAVEFTHAPWYAGITYDYAAAAYPVGRWGTVFGSVTSVLGEFTIRDALRRAVTGRGVPGDIPRMRFERRAAAGGMVEIVDLHHSALALVERH